MFKAFDVKINDQISSRTAADLNKIIIMIFHYNERDYEIIQEALYVSSSSSKYKCLVFRSNS